MSRSKLTKFERDLVGSVLQAPVTEQGMVLDPETEKPLGVCSAPEIRNEDDCTIIKIKASPFKPIKYIKVNVNTIDRSDK